MSFSLSIERVFRSSGWLYPMIYRFGVFFCGMPIPLPSVERYGTGFSWSVQAETEAVVWGRMGESIEGWILPATFLFCSYVGLSLTFSADRDGKFWVSVNKTHKKEKHFRWDLVDFLGGEFKLGLCTTLLFHTWTVNKTNKKRCR